FENNQLNKALGGRTSTSDRGGSASYWPS
ncbi:hypothetical protein GWI33_000828, partial [Rhynchophorus ferrugineus]